MLSKIRALAEEAIAIQNKMLMEENLKEIVLMCGEKAMSEESITFPEIELQEAKELVEAVLTPNPLADIDEAALEINAVEVPEEVVTEKPVKAKGKK